MLSVYAPASIGNIGVGFDLLGAAISPIDGSLLGDVISILGPVKDDYLLEVVGPYKDSLPSESKQNVVYQCCSHFYQALSMRAVADELPYLSLRLNKRLPVGSGLGSSATSIVATFKLLNEYHDQPFSDTELLIMMGHFEAQLSGSLHYDNVAPCFLGGIQLMTEDQQICTELPVPEGWYWVMAYSGINVSTKAARAVLPKNLDMATAKAYARNLATFIDALHKGHWVRAASVIHDVVAEPYRKNLLPGFTQVREELLSQGALACGISGSGPTIFAIAQDLSQAEQFRTTMIKHYLQNEQGFCHICTLDQQGARIFGSERNPQEEY